MAAIAQTEGNRAQRRAAKKQKRGGVNVYHYQNRRHGGICHPLPHQVDAAFSSLELMIQEIKDGNVRVVGEDDIPVIWIPAQAKHVDLVVALNRWLAVWERISVEFSVPLDQTALSKMTEDLKAGKLLEMDDVLAAEAVVARQRHLYAWELDVFDVRDFIQKLDAEKSLPQ